MDKRKHYKFVHQGTEVDSKYCGAKRTEEIARAIEERKGWTKFSVGVIESLNQ